MAPSSAVGLVGFCGSRRLPGAFAPLVARVVAAVEAAGRGVVVGCATGADEMVRRQARAPLVLAVASGRWGQGRVAYAARSQALVRHVAAAGRGSGLVGFVSGPCPAGIGPARRWRRGASPSGSWSTLALGAGLGLPVVVFPCSWGWEAPEWPGGWEAAGPGVWADGWRWVPPGVQLGLF